VARELGLPVADKNDSQEICFVPNGDYTAFLDAYFREQGQEPPRTRGELVALDGRRLCEHTGVRNFTVDSARGSGIAAGEPLYVIRPMPQRMRVVVGRRMRTWFAGGYGRAP